MIFNKLLSFYCPLGINGGIFFFPGKSRWKRRSFSLITHSANLKTARETSDRFSAFDCAEKTKQVPILVDKIWACGYNITTKNAAISGRAHLLVN